MLTAFQARTVAYMGDGFVIHAHCLTEAEQAVMDWDQDRGEWNLRPLSQFEVDGMIHDGWTCDRCMEWIVEPDEDYCIVHNGWRHPNVRSVCERGTAGFEEACRFYGEQYPGHVSGDEWRGAASHTGADEAPGMTLAELLGEEEE